MEPLFLLNLGETEFTTTTLLCCVHRREKILIRLYKTKHPPGGKKTKDPSTLSKADVVV